jgi:hypothetical protein
VERHFIRELFCVKGIVALDFCPLVLFINRPHLGSCLLYKFFFEFFFEFAELFEFEIRTALWAKAENQIFFADAVDLKLGWCRPLLILFIYIHFLAFTVPLKDMANF